eukprot:3555202-Pleurochrysis_carterae.AAC.1
MRLKWLAKSLAFNRVSLYMEGSVSQYRSFRWSAYLFQVLTREGSFCVGEGRSGSSWFTGWDAFFVVSGRGARRTSLAVHPRARDPARRLSAARRADASVDATTAWLSRAPALRQLLLGRRAGVLNQFLEKIGYRAQGLEKSGSGAQALTTGARRSRRISLQSVRCTSLYHLTPRLLQMSSMRLIMISVMNHRQQTEVATASTEARMLLHPTKTIQEWQQRLRRQSRPTPAKLHAAVSFGSRSLQQLDLHCLPVGPSESS